MMSGLSFRGWIIFSLRTVVSNLALVETKNMIIFCHIRADGVLQLPHIPQPRYFEIRLMATLVVSDNSCYFPLR